MRRFEVIVLAAAIAGCKGKPKDDRSVAADVDDSLFVVARPRVSAGGAPPIFRLDLPSSAAGIGLAPPAPHVEVMLATDGAGMRARFLAAVTKAAPPSAELRDWFVDRLEGALPDACDWIASVAT